MPDMPLSDTETPSADADELLCGWDLGIIPPIRRRRTTFLPGKVRCTVCGCSISDHQWRLFQTCDLWECRAQHRRHQRALQKKIDERRCHQQEKIERRVRLLREKAAGLLGIDGPERFMCAVVPALKRSVTRLPNKRRSALGNHLRGLIAEVNKKRIGFPGNPPYESEQAVVPNGSLRPLPVVAQACATCQGYCCVGGGDRAYLDVETVLRCLKKYPEFEATDMIAFFISYVEAYTYKDSCIYHGANGCSLPRDVRSSTCNGFECTGIRMLIERFTGLRPHRAFLVATEKNQVIRYEFVHV